MTKQELFEECVKALEGLDHVSGCGYKLTLVGRYVGHRLLPDADFVCSSESNVMDAIRPIQALAAKDPEFDTRPAVGAAPTLKLCVRCDEDAIVIPLAANQFFVRVRRASKCKLKKMGICKTAICETRELAIAEWNEKHGVLRPAEGAARGAGE